MIHRKRRKVIHGEVLSFVRTFTRAAKMNKPPSEEKMVKGIMRQIEKKARLKKAFKWAWGRNPTPTEIYSLRTRPVIETKMKPLGRYVPDEEIILLKNLDPRTVMHEWTHFVELSHMNKKKRIEYLHSPNWAHRVSSETYAVLSEVAVDIVMAQKTGRITPSLKHQKKKLTPKEKQEIIKKVFLSWMKFLREHSSIEEVKKIASNRRRNWEEFAAYARAFKEANKVLKKIYNEYLAKKTGR